jgi:hypothetical protein
MGLWRAGFSLQDGDQPLFLLCFLPLRKTQKNGVFGSPSRTLAQEADGRQGQPFGLLIRRGGAPLNPTGRTRDSRNKLSEEVICASVEQSIPMEKLPARPPEDRPRDRTEGAKAAREGCGYFEGG